MFRRAAPAAAAIRHASMHGSIDSWGSAWSRRNFRKRPNGALRRGPGARR